MNKIKFSELPEEIQNFYLDTGEFRHVLWAKSGIDIKNSEVYWVMVDNRSVDNRPMDIWGYNGKNWYRRGIV